MSTFIRLNQGRTNRLNAPQQLAAQVVREKDMEGTEVEILAAGTYNGPNHKSLGLLQPGTVVRVASGGYAASLIESGMVRPTAAPVAPVLAKAPEPPAVVPEPTPEPEEMEPPAVLPQPDEDAANAALPPVVPTKATTTRKRV